MREATANRIEQIIKRHMPVGAVVYFFQQVTAENQVVRFPETGFFKLIAPFEFPIGVPSGTYQVFFMRSLADAHPLPPRDPEYPYPEVDFFYASSPATRAPQSDQARPIRARPRSSDGGTPDPLREAHREYDKQKLTMQLARDQLGLDKSRSYTQEVGEVFTLNQSYRYELADSAKMLTAHPKQMAENMIAVSSMVKRMTEMSMDMFELHRKRLTEFANPVPPPPPPPPPQPAYLAVIQALMPLMVPIGVAAFTSFGLASRLPPELMNVLVASLSAMTSQSPSGQGPVHQVAQALIDAQQASTSQSRLPAPAETAAKISTAETAGQAAASPEDVSEVAAEQSISSLQPLANEVLTVKNLQRVLSALQKPDAPPELKQLLTQWTAAADGMVPSRAARLQNGSALPGNALSIQDLHYVLSIIEQEDTPESKKLLALWITLASGLAPKRPPRREVAPTPSETQPLLSETDSAAPPEIEPPLPEADSSSRQVTEPLRTTERAPSSSGIHSRPPEDLPLPAGHGSPPDENAVRSLLAIDPADGTAFSPPTVPDPPHA